MSAYLTFCYFYCRFPACYWIVFFWVPAVSNFLRHLKMSSMILINLLLSFTRTSATPTLLSFTSVSEAKALSANIARLYKDVLSGVVARCARMDTDICRIKAWLITALPTTAVVPKPAVFWRRLRKRDGMSDPNFSPEISLFTRSGVVNPRRSISTPLRLIYLCLRKGCNRISRTSDATSPNRAAQVSRYLSSSSVLSCRSNWVSIWLNHSSTSFDRMVLS